jgi:hypothetical protein
MRADSGRAIIAGQRNPWVTVTTFRLVLANIEAARVM